MLFLHVNAFSKLAATACPVESGESDWACYFYFVDENSSHYTLCDRDHDATPISAMYVDAMGS